jgi:hypothetical protein
MSTTAAAPRKRTARPAEARITSNTDVAAEGKRDVNRVVYGIAKTAAVAGVVIVDYVLAMFVAMKIVPMIAASTASGLGIDPQGAVSGVIVWLLAASTLTVFVVIVALIAMRSLWRLQRKVLTAFRTRTPRS